MERCRESCQPKKGTLKPGDRILVTCSPDILKAYSDSSIVKDIDFEHRLFVVIVNENEDLDPKRNESIGFKTMDQALIDKLGSDKTLAIDQ